MNREKVLPRIYYAVALGIAAIALAVQLSVKDGNNATINAAPVPTPTLTPVPTRVITEVCDRVQKGEGVLNVGERLPDSVDGRYILKRVTTNGNVSVFDRGSLVQSNPTVRTGDKVCVNAQR